MTEIKYQNDFVKSDSEEITINELLLKIKGLIIYLIAKWRLGLLFGLLGASLGLVYSIIKKPIYSATLTFVLEEEKSGTSGLSGALGLASSFGFDLGGGSGGIFTGANVIELMKSRSLVEKALLIPITIDNKNVSLANYYIEFNKLKKDWGDNEELKNIQFEPFADRSKFTIQQDSILGKLYEQIAGPNGLGILTVSQKDKKVSIITVEVQSTNELFAKSFTVSIANVVSDFYIETKTKKAKYNYEILQKQTDSVRNELNISINEVAIANDNTYNLNPALNVKRTTSAKRQVDVQANTAILTQLVANLEMAKVTLRKETPLIQVIDSPILPLKKEKVGKLFAFFVGGVLAYFLFIIILIIKRTWNSIINNMR